VGLAEAFAPRVRVNAILPGPFRIDISRAWRGDLPSDRPGPGEAGNLPT
jgi:NAD(P)-dependent dehydrogenase (short-subunit alcohol dehydrogenase family)